MIVDPLSSFLGGNIENLNHEVRRVLTQLGRLAARLDLAIVAITHLRKARGSALHRTLGSLAFPASAPRTSNRFLSHFRTISPPTCEHL